MSAPDDRVYMKDGEPDDEAGPWIVVIMPDDKDANPYFVKVDDILAEALRVAETITAEYADVRVFVEPWEPFVREAADGVVEEALKDAGGLQ